MKDFIKNELVRLRSIEPIGSKRHNELTEAIQWVEKQVEKPKEKEPPKSDLTNHAYAKTTIMWKENCEMEEVIISLTPFDDTKKEIDDVVFFYCENYDDYERLHDYDNGEDFVVIGCTLFIDNLK